MRWSVVAAIILVIGASAAAQASAPNPSKEGQLELGYGAAVTFAAKAAVPSGYYQLCVKPSVVCQTSGGAQGIVEDGVVRLNSRLLGQLTTVNAAVNRDIRPVPDAVLLHVADRWSVGPKKGDCEDFALTKKARLLKLGWPSSALLIALANTSSGEEHAVLVARTDHGDFVLDNLRKDVRRWSSTLYRWKAIQGPQGVWAWYQFGAGEVRVAKTVPPVAIPTARVFADLPLSPDDRDSTRALNSRPPVATISVVDAAPIVAGKTAARELGQTMSLARDAAAPWTLGNGSHLVAAAPVLLGPRIVTSRELLAMAAGAPFFSHASLLVEVDLTLADLMRERIVDPISVMLSPRL